MIIIPRPPRSLDDHLSPHNSRQSFGGGNSAWMPARYSIYMAIFRGTGAVPRAHSVGICESHSNRRASSRPDHPRVFRVALKMAGGIRRYGSDGGRLWRFMWLYSPMSAADRAASQFFASPGDNSSSPNDFLHALHVAVTHGPISECTLSFCL